MGRGEHDPRPRERRLGDHRVHPRPERLREVDPGNQVVHYRLAELSTEIEALRALTYRATELYVKGQDVTRLASMAKLKAGRLGREVADSCLQYWGGMGFMWEAKIARLYRDVRLASIGGGADEIMLGIICKMDGTLPKRKKGGA